MGLKQEFHPKAEVRHWIAQRVGWAAISIALVLAVLGLFGSGLFSDATKSVSAEGVEVSLEYPRFARLHSPERLNIKVLAPEASGTLSVTLSEGFAEEISVRGMAPEPDSTTITPEGHTYEWSVDDWSGELFVSFEYWAEDWRRVSGEIRVQAGDFNETISFTQFVFP